MMPSHLSAESRATLERLARENATTPAKILNHIDAILSRRVVSKHFQTNVLAPKRTAAPKGV